MISLSTNFFNNAPVEPEPMCADPVETNPVATDPVEAGLSDSFVWQHF